jgi:hypothetical protein
VRERGETWAVDPDLVAPIGDEIDASTAELCRHIDEVGESLEMRVSGLEDGRKPRRPRRRR